MNEIILELLAIESALNPITAEEATEPHTYHERSVEYYTDLYQRQYDLLLVNLKEILTLALRP